MEHHEKECNHNIEDPKNSLKKLSKRTMVYPPKDEYICTICHNFFEIKKQEE